MKILIAYASNHGCAEKAAKQLGRLLGDKNEIFNLGEKTIPGIDDFDVVILGGSIHAGKLQKTVRKFLTQHESQLLKKKLGLFLCCMYDGAKADKQFEDSFPEKLRQHATAAGLFGGAFDFDKMSFFEKAIVRKVAGVKESISKVDEEAIQTFAQQMQTK